MGYKAPRTMKALGKLLRDIRESQDLTQVDIANRSGLTRQQVGLIELGKNVTIRTLDKLLAATGHELEIMYNPPKTKEQTDE